MESVLLRRIERGSAVVVWVSIVAGCGGTVTEPTDAGIQDVATTDGAVSDAPSELGTDADGGDTGGSIDKLCDALTNTAVCGIEKKDCCAATGLGFNKERCIEWYNDGWCLRAAAAVKSGLALYDETKLAACVNSFKAGFVMRMVSSLRGASPGRLTVITGSAGDRSDHEIEALAQAVHDAGPDRVLVRELLGYLRGRAPGEVPTLFQRAFRSLGLADEAFAYAHSEVDALRRALDGARAGDFIVLLVHLDHDEVRAFLDAG